MSVRVLRQARQVLVEGGWCQKHLYDQDGRHCALGAIQEARDRLGLLGFGGLGAFEHLRRAIGGQHIAKWNDKRGRKRPAVLAAFTRAIKLASRRAK